MIELMRRSKTRTAMAGFTLVETLVAVALMAVVLAAIGVITAQWLPNWSRGFSRVQRSELVSIALDRIVADLGAAEFITPNRDSKQPLFSGSELDVTFVRTAYGPNAKHGLEVVRIAESADRQGLALARSTTPFAPSHPLNFANPVVLLRVPYRVSFAYAGRDGVWKNAWQNEAELPAIVRLTVRDAATERALAVSTAALVHVELPATCVRPKNKGECGALAAEDARAPDQAKPQSLESLQDGFHNGQ
jgi:general secretion pathway protein J